MTAPSSDSELDELLTAYKYHDLDSYTGKKLDRAEAKAALLAWNKQRVNKARLDELHRLKNMAERVRQPWFIPYIELDSRIIELTTRAESQGDE